MTGKRHVVKAAAILLALLLIGTAGISYAGRPAPGPDAKQKAYDYLVSQIKGIGMVDSNKDSVNDSYTYDDALTVIAFTAMADYARAAALLGTFQNTLGLPSYGGYNDVYDFTTGVGRGAIAAGPNAWLLDAVNFYQYASGDTQFQPLARHLADFLISLQDADGGLFGDDYAPWKSTENNLAAYAGLYNYGILNNEAIYTEKASLIRDFIITECWNGERFLRGENDPIEVTDVQALGVLSLGTSYASAIYWAEYHTKCTKRLGTKNVTGFDFNNDLDTVWFEGTLQEAMAFNKNYDDYRAGIYSDNAKKGQTSYGSFYCATNRGTTGTDWILSKIESAAPTAWYIFYATNSNPLMR